MSTGLGVNRFVFDIMMHIDDDTNATIEELKLSTGEQIKFSENKKQYSEKILMNMLLDFLI